MRNFLNRVIVIPEKLYTALHAALLVIAVQLEVWIAELVSRYLGVEVDFAGAFSVLAAIVALLLVALLKKFLESVVPEPWHPIVNSFLVWLAGFLGALALLRSLG